MRMRRSTCASVFVEGKVRLTGIYLLITILFPVTESEIINQKFMPDAGAASRTTQNRAASETTDDKYNFLLFSECRTSDPYKTPTAPAKQDGLSSSSGRINQKKKTFLY